MSASNYVGVKLENINEISSDISLFFFLFFFVTVIVFGLFVCLFVCARTKKKVYGICVISSSCQSVNPVLTNTLYFSSLPAAEFINYCNCLL